MLAELASDACKQELTISDVQSFPNVFGKILSFAEHLKELLFYEHILKRID